MSIAGKPLRILSISLDRDLLCRSEPNEAQARQLIYARELPANTVILTKTFLGADKSPLELESGLVRVIPCPVRHWSLFPMAGINKGARILSNGGFDIIQVQEPFISGVVGLYLSYRFKLPLVVGVYSDEIDNPIWIQKSLRNRFANKVGKIVLRHASAIRTDSEAVANRLRSSGFEKAMSVPFLITNSEMLAKLAENRIKMRQELLDGQSGPLLLAVMRLEQEKNIPMMLEGFGRIIDAFPGAVLAIAGDGSLRSELETIAGYSLSGRVRWLGRVANESLPAIYQAADLFLLTSNIESSARVLTESLLAGTPVLTTDTSGAREVIEDGKSGRVVPIGDIEIFSATLTEMCRDLERLKDMGLYGKQRILELVSTEAVIQGMRRIYSSALGSGE